MANAAVEYLRKAFRISALNQLRRRLRPRRSQLFGVGMAKSGTHSIAEMFDDTVNARHEPEGRQLILKILEIAAGRMNAGEQRSYVRRRDRRLNLDVDSSQLNFFILEALVAEFKDARYLLTIRDPYSWLDSFINDSLRRQITPQWRRLRDLRFRPELFSHSNLEQVLKQKGLYTLDGYLSYWSMHNQRVLDIVSPDKLLVVRTDQISAKTAIIADFARLPRETVRMERSHAFQNPKKFDVLGQIEQAYLKDKVEQYCRPLMSRFFPEISSLGTRSIPNKPARPLA